MASAAVDHMISLTIFIAAILIFIGLFSQTMQTGITYERHNALSTKTSDLLDTILLNPGLPVNWGQTDNAIVGFGLQDPDYSQYKLSSFSAMRLSSSTQSSVYYPRTGAYYNNITSGFGGYLLAPTAKSLNYSTASKLLGINGTYGFKLTLTPTITVLIEKISVGAPLKLSVNVAGTGNPLANASVSYSLIVVNQDGSDYPSYRIISGTDKTNEAGSIPALTFSEIDGESQSYALIIYSYLNGLNGVGYYVHDSASLNKNVVPLIDSFQNRTILLAHGDSLGQPPEHPSYSQLSYNASFVIVSEDYALRQIQLDQPSSVGKVSYGSSSEQEYATVTIPNNGGVLIVTYKGTAGQYGVVLMPWGLGSMAFPLNFGGNSSGQDWVTTDLRQVTIGGIAYQAKLELWNLQGYQGVG